MCNLGPWLALKDWLTLWLQDKHPHGRELDTARAMEYDDQPQDHVSQGVEWLSWTSRSMQVAAASWCTLYHSLGLAHTAIAGITSDCKTQLCQWREICNAMYTDQFSELP